MRRFPGLSLRNPIDLLALGLGSGLAPKAPGTFGTLAAVPLVYAMLLLDVTSYTVVMLLCTLVGIYICRSAADKMGVHDHPAIVWDEFVGLMFTMWALPANFGLLVLGFLVFRVFDILKPWPISWLDKRLHGGTGIMLDDVLAGVASHIVLQLILATSVGSDWLAAA
ncbi:phosphatidylglycerophosphatase A [Idiomarina fontislapidosi]|uniref:Phosphatidylglycerophosphatase A n=1 Tax=Idiomarina fontislapidosi TaxID=263723 RepID=A0A432Y8E9_9GAMM|nr:phosphatidylglycerophosphatase A [Idiomarina fontislapidosi]PYE33859.1 phosphatidylglycerophosphatase A [Idiomarina fontislapidosi]RUO57249.1 phosphatidylglycerophosphatase A [Idiomarina fontislapidosi]|tara:strand:- start:6433 stop:6933 length:501 start_codon:yes stop_codon:yes gene_type:complete